MSLDKLYVILLIIILLIVLFIPTYLFGQNMSNSIGVITLNGNNYSEENGVIELLDYDGEVWHSFTFYYDDSDGKWDYPNDNFQIIAFHPDYFLLKMKCVAQDDEFYTVIVNEESQLKKRVKRNSKLTLQTWEQYVMDVFSISFDALSNPILNDINGERINVKLPEYPIFQPVQIKEEWMKIKWSIDGMPTIDSKYEFGWIRWKSYNRILIEVFFTS